MEITIDKYSMRMIRHVIAMTIFTLLITACDKHKKIKLPGYVDGKYAYISVMYSGKMKSLDVKAGDVVSINQKLFSLDPLPESDDVLSATARSDQAKSNQSKIAAEYQLQKSVFDRKSDLYRKNVISKEEFDMARAKYQEASSQLTAADANVLALESELNKSKWMLDQKNIVSPISALVFDTFYSVGELVPANKPVVSLLAPSQVKIVFYCYEPYLSEIKLNQQIDIFCDHCPKPIKARISYISANAEYTPPVIYSTEERTKLSFRIEAVPLMKNVLEVLHPGQPVTVKLVLNPAAKPG